MRVIITEQGGELIRSLGQDKILQKLQKAQMANEHENTLKKKTQAKESNLNNTSDLEILDRKSSKREKLKEFKSNRNQEQKAQHS